MKSNTTKKPTTRTRKENATAFASSGARSVGTSLSHYSLHGKNGFIIGPDYQHLTKYEVAFRTDPMINRALNFIKLSMVHSLGNYVHPNPEMSTFVRDMINKMEGNLKDEMAQLVISGLWSGFGVSEIMYRAEGDKILIKRLTNYHPRSISIVTDTHGQLTHGERNAAHPYLPYTGIWQELPTMLIGSRKVDRRHTFYNNFVRLPEEKLVFVTHNKRHGNFYGESALAPIWTRYQMVMETWQNLMITTERYGSPQVAAIVPNGITSAKIPDPAAPGGERYKTIAEAAQDSMANLSTTSALVFEEPIGLGTNEKIRLQALTSFNNFGDNFLKTISHIYGDILVGLGVPPLLFMEHSGGLGAGTIAQVHADTYKQFITALYKEFAEPFCEQVIGRLLKINFGETDPGHFEFNPLDIAAADTIIKTFTSGVQFGFIDPTEEDDLQMVRSRIGVPLATEQSVSRRLKNNKTLMATVRRPDIDKVEVAKLRADSVIEGHKIISDSQMKNTAKQTDTQLKIVNLNNEVKREVEVEKQKNDLKKTRIQAKNPPKPPTSQ